MTTVHAFAGTVLEIAEERFMLEVAIFVEGSMSDIEKGLRKGKPTSAPCRSLYADMIWNMTCSFPSLTSQSYYSEAFVYALAETSMRVRCPTPAGAAVESSAEAVEFSLSLHIEEGSTLPLWLKSRPKENRGQILACSRPMRDVGEIVGSYPLAVRDWLGYHYRMGISHFELYDDDGSLLSYIPERMMRDGVVSYFPNWARRFGKLDEATKQGWRYCTEILAFDHCAYRNTGHRTGLSIWAVLMFICLCLKPRRE